MPEELPRDPKRRSKPIPALGMEGIDVSPRALVDQSTFIRTARPGPSGNVVRQAVGVLGHRELFVPLLGTTAGNLSRYYRRKALGQAQSEALLDTFRLVARLLLSAIWNGPAIGLTRCCPGWVANARSTSATPSRGVG